MRGFEVYVAASAWRHIQLSIDHYVDHGAPASARRLLEGIDLLLDRLQTSFEANPIYHAPPAFEVPGELRVALVDRHKIIYYLLRAQREVIVFAVIPDAFGDDRISERLRE